VALIILENIDYFYTPQLAAGNKNNEDSKGNILWLLAGCIPRQQGILDLKTAIINRGF